jgi:hypothetical protein
VQEARSIYGLGLQANVAIAGLTGLAPCKRTDVSLTIGALPAKLADATRVIFYESDDRDENGLPMVAGARLLRGTYFELAYSDGTRVVIDERATQIWAQAPQGATVEDTAAYVLGPVLGFALRLRGVTCLHASSIAVGDGAVAFVGAAGAGKSTLAAAFARRGNSVLTDDVAPLDENRDGFYVRPAYPRIRLWPESVGLLFGAADALPRITPTWEKCFLSLVDGNYRFAREPLRLRTVYLIGNRIDGGPRLEPVAKRDALIALVRDTYGTRFLDRDRRAAEFGVLGRLVDRVPIRRLFTGTDPSMISRLAELVANDDVA